MSSNELDIPKEMTKISSVADRDEDNSRSGSRRVGLGVRQAIYVRNVKSFKMVNVCNVILRKALENSMVNILFINIKDTMKEMLENIGLVIACDGHDEVG